MMTTPEVTATEICNMWAPIRREQSTLDMMNEYLGHLNYPPLVDRAQEEKEKKMRTETYVTLDASQGYSVERESRSHLRSRLQSMLYAKDHELEIKFGIRGGDKPATLNEMIKAIKDGQYRIDNDHGDEPVYYYQDYIIWGDPSIKKDQLGYKAAYKLMKDKYDSAMDSIEVLSSVEGLAALNDFSKYQA